MQFTASPRTFARLLKNSKIIKETNKLYARKSNKTLLSGWNHSVKSSTMKREKT